MTRWGMAIDTDRCTGCGACVVACHAENNIQTVGEVEAAKGRAMHWMRIERYYEHVDATQAGDLDVRFLPMLCQHCNNAPCEPVCPVFATYHTPEGVNAQIYNRCVGTRYCGNNCPYKVRVFNFFSPEFPEPLNRQLNPDVTVRGVGIMEKCTFCVQRIRRAREQARVENRAVTDGEILPACAQTCPTGAMVFGDLNDPGSEVSGLFNSERRLFLLDFLETKPSIAYLKRGGS
jgi:molybdopterin-containing oxidoreductase family iron-sulfur binding subunit